MQKPTHFIISALFSLIAGFIFGLAFMFILVPESFLLYMIISIGLFAISYKVFNTHITEDEEEIKKIQKASSMSYFWVGSLIFTIFFGDFEFGIITILFDFFFMVMAIGTTYLYFKYGK